MKVSNFIIFVVSLVQSVTSSISVSDTRDPSVICELNECYSKVFIASTEFQIIKPGQHIPKGLHVRVNMETGLKEAKIIDNENTFIDTQSMHLNQDLIIQDEPVKLKEKKEQSSKLTLKEKSDFDLYLIKALDSSNNLIDSLIEVVTQIDFGIHFVNSKFALEKVNNMIHSTNDNDVIKATLLLGSAVQNNPIAQSAVNDSPLNFTQSLITLLMNYENTKVAKKVLFAISTLIRSDLIAISNFEAMNGFKSLKDAWQNELLRGKIERLLTDLTDGQMFVESKGYKFDSVFKSDWCMLVEDRLREVIDC